MNVDTEEENTSGKVGCLYQCLHVFLFSGEDEVIELQDIQVMQGIKGVIFQGFRVLAKNPPLGTIIKRVANIYNDGQTLL